MICFDSGVFVGVGLTQIKRRLMCHGDEPTPTLDTKQGLRLISHSVIAGTLRLGTTQTTGSIHTTYQYCIPIQSTTGEMSTDL